MTLNTRVLSALLLSILLMPARSWGRDVPPRFVPKAAVASSPRALPATEDTPDLREALERHAVPRSLAAADLDGDGMPELAAGFALPGGSGLVAVWRGNPDALFPHSEAAREHREKGTFTEAPFLGRRGSAGRDRPEPDLGPALRSGGAAGRPSGHSMPRASILR